MSPLPHQPSPSRARRLRLPLVGVVAIFGVTLSLATYRYNREVQRAHLESEFTRRAEIHHALTREIVNHSVSAVFSLQSLFGGSDEVSLDEFHRSSRAILSRYSGITALEWIPVVAASDRAAVEARISGELGRPFQFTEQATDPDRRMIRARDRDEHFPILMIEPMAGNERAFGFDVKSAATAAFIEQARRTRQLVVTTHFQLVQGRRGIVIISPVFTADSICRGFVQGVFRVDEMLALTQLGSPPDATEILFIDDTATAPEARILYHSPIGEAAGPAAVSEADFRRGLHREHIVEFGGRRWIAIYRPTAGWIAQQQTTHPKLWLAAGLVITALIAGLVFSMARRTAAIEKLVADRTGELEESRRQLDNLLHALPGMAFRARYNGSVTVLFVSEGASSLCGWSPADFMNGTIHFRDVTHPDDVERVRAATRAALEHRRDFEIESRILTREGHEKWVLTRGRGVYAADGALQFFEGLAIDITARRQAETEKLAIERKLLESQKLESLGLLAGGIAHDFNNLLTGILGHASLARHQSDPNSEVAEHLRKIETGSGRAAELCQQMLAYSGRGRFLVENIELGRLIRDTLPLLRGSLSPRARLELALSPHPAIISADATQIRQIVMNLILNAGDALGAAGGEIVVTTARRWIDAAFLATARVGESLAPGYYVTLEVRDNGSGMSADTLAKIFDPFFTTKFTGRGLGLAAVLGIVRGHSGALRVQSELGSGTTFTLLFPPSAGAPGSTRAAASATPWRQKGKILVIDDEAPVREVAAQLIATFGFTVVTAPDGAMGLAEFSRQPADFDLVFLDLTMPGLDGEETLQALRTISPHVRVLLVSGYSESERVAHLATRGPLLFLQKPFTRAALEQKLREILP